jgi:hypothetical protein
MAVRSTTLVAALLCIAACGDERPEPAEESRDGGHSELEDGAATDSDARAMGQDAAVDASSAPRAEAGASHDAAGDGLVDAAAARDATMTSVGGDAATNTQLLPPLDCGPSGVAVENSGPPENRVNYVIVGDGYSEEQLDTRFLQHIRTALAKRFGPIGEPYGRYRKFVNICALKVASPSSPIGSGPTPFSCTGDDQSRLARCNQQAVNAALAERLPKSFEVDWKAVVLNNDRWWNTGAVLMLWSGAHPSAAGAALHEGGHGFHQLADEYEGTNGNCAREYGEVNSTADMARTAGKWDRWLGYVQTGATGRQGVFPGSRYCASEQFRPSDNSMMNSLFGDNPNTSFNAVSREKMIMDIWRIVRPIDGVMPPAGALMAPTRLSVRVIDPAVIDVEWSVDGMKLAQKGPELDIAALRLTAGAHTITARAYDNAGEELVRYRDGGAMYGRMNWARSEQSVSWMVTLP